MNNRKTKDKSCSVCRDAGKVGCPYLAFGTYRLTEDFVSPWADGRKRDWWNKRTIKKGTLFQVQKSWGLDLQTRKIVEYDGFAFVPVGCASDLSCLEDSWRGLLDLLVPIEETPSLYLQRTHRDGGLVLDRLLAAGKITMQDVIGTFKERK